MAARASRAVPRGQAAAPAPLYREQRIHSWMHFLRLMTNSPYENWAFKGIGNADWPLRSALSRYLINFRINPRAWPEQESRILRVFKNKAHNFLDHPPEHDDVFQWLALMQHHGAPTRLIDFSWSPYVAAFFALERATTDSAIWALNTMEIERLKIRKGRSITPQRVDPRRKGNFEKYFLKGNLPFVWIGEPQQMNRRLIVQSGTFAVPGVLDKPLDEILTLYDDPAHLLVKFILPHGMRDQGMRELYRMKITHESMFPDLDGLARSLGYELEFHWAYDPRTMRPLAKQTRPGGK